VDSSLRRAAAPLYLFGCLILGGSERGVLQNMVLELWGLAILSWSAASSSGQFLPSRARQFLMIAMAAVAVVAIQSVPLPTNLFASAVRARLADGNRLLGRPVLAAPLSLTPYESLATLLAIIPPLAIFCAVVRLQAYRVSWLMAALLTGTIAQIILTAQQLAPRPGSAWHPYAQTKGAVAIGFLACGNHLADLLLIALAFVLGIGVSRKNRNLQRYPARLIGLIAILILLIAGFALANCVAGYALAIPVLVASVLMFEIVRGRWRRVTLLLAALSLLGSVTALSLSSTSATAFGNEAAASVQSRGQILATTVRAITDFLPLGSGLGSFARVYPLYERPAAIMSAPVPHAYNDYAEIALELGLPGIMVMLVFLVGWAAAVSYAWQGRQGSPFVRAASIASAAILVHSVFDFPLRTAAISASFAMCLGLLVAPQTQRRPAGDDLRPTRHLVIT
jgi:O-antigen ligase